MIYVQIANDGSITEVTDGDRDARPSGSVALTDAEAATLATHPVGHSAFDYTGGQLVENTTRRAAYDLRRNQAAMVAKIRAHALGLIGGLVPALANADTLDLVIELYQAGAFRAVFPTAGSDMARVKDIYIYAKGKITQARTATQAQLDAYDPATDTGWP